MHAQKIDNIHFYTTWSLDKYSENGEYYFPPKKERGDYISLNPDMTFTSKAEGKDSSGTWIFNANGKYIELKSASGDIEKLYIHFLSDKSMIVTYDVDKYRLWHVHYVSKA
ncbi:MAG: hypothetical protein AAFW89_11465 [Bacteroidota bacterium]